MQLQTLTESGTSVTAVESAKSSATGKGATAVGAREHANLVAQLIFLPVSLLITVEMLSARLPTTIGRAFLVTLCEMLVVLLVGGVLVGIAILVFAVALRGA